eukprot:INCI20350.1.p1 GENE.INCI20350.1~~INCI20350.1.p1  ORF type:complete len:298 (-),score=42.14 INCI20350.1:99-920(-)
MSEKLSDFENSQVGLLCGVLEVSLLQSLNYFKNARQQGLPLTLDPRVLYRGYTAAVINMGGCTMVQVAVMGRVKKILLGDQTDGEGPRTLTNSQQFGAGFFAGVTSAAVGGPVELAMIQQQRTGNSLIATVGSLIGPNIARGMLPTAIREGLWSMGYLSVPPVIGSYLRSSMPETFDSDDKARVPASFLGAGLVCYGSHPFDTAKTCMQGDIEQRKFKSMRATFATLYKESGIGGFYRGVPWRFLRQAIAIFSMDKARGIFTDLLFPETVDGM